MNSTNVTKLDLKQVLIETACGLLHELGIPFGFRDITLQSSLQSHLGLDSITRAEFFHRIEKKLNIRIADSLLAKAQTLKDIFDNIYDAHDQHFFEKHSEISLIKTEIDPQEAHSLIEVLILHATHTPNKPHIYFQNESGSEEVITYGNLLENAQRVAFNLIKKGIEAGDAVAIMLPTHPNFFYAFFGILLAKAIPVPIYPPANSLQLEKFVKRAAKVLANAEARMLISFEKAELIAKILKPFVPTLRFISDIQTLVNHNEKAELFFPHAGEHALIQYTSGSTSDPKGILLTHENVLSNIRAYSKALEITASDVCVSWLPLYHDLGLIGNWLGSLYTGTPLVLLTPLTFLNRPEKWLWAIHYYKGTISSGPNFGYEICASKIPSSNIEGLNLSSWRIAINGAEIIHPSTMQRFTKRYSAYGFKAEAMLPVYGLAETALGLTASPLNRKPWVDKIDRSAFEKKQIAIPSIANDALEFVSCGKVLEKHFIKIVDDNHQELAERNIGRLVFKGPSSMLGYFNNPDATQNILHDGWLDSGDLAYRVGDEFFIVGRKKDVIIKAGHNLFPAEIEAICAEVQGVRKGCVIAFSVEDKNIGTEKLIVVAETNHEKNNKKIMLDMQEKLIASLNITLDQIVLVPPRMIPKTSSGKLQRSICKKMYLENKLKQKNRIWSQWLSISTSWFGNRIKRFAKNTFSFLFSFYIATLILSTLPIIWLLVATTPRYVAARVFKYWARLLCLCSFLPIKINGQVSKHQAIYVANHASYIDIVLLLSVLPADIRVVGKKELFKAPILKTFLKKLNHIMIDKFDKTKGSNELLQIKGRLQQQQSVLIFPEGTFSYARGLRPFKLGAFKLASEAQVPICPVAINGSRFILRGEEKLLKFNPLKINIGNLIVPINNSWEALIRIKEHAYTFIAAHCGEPVLDLIVAETSGNKKKKTLVE